jgi:hypothetical protein
LRATLVPLAEPSTAAVGPAPRAIEATRTLLLVANLARDGRRGAAPDVPPAVLSSRRRRLA